MVVLKLKNNTDKSYEDVRDEICTYLVGNPAFKDNHIVVSDALQDDNTITITLQRPEVDTPSTLHVEGSIDDLVHTA